MGQHLYLCPFCLFWFLELGRPSGKIRLSPRPFISALFYDFPPRFPSGIHDYWSLSSLRRLLLRELWQAGRAGVGECEGHGYSRKSPLLWGRPGSRWVSVFREKPQILWSKVNIRPVFRPPFSLQPFWEKTYHEALNRLLTDSKKFEKKWKAKTGESGNENAGARGG